MRDIERTVLVDMDGVMADFDGAAVEAVEPGSVVPRMSFYVVQDYPTRLSEIIRETYNAPGFFESLAPMPGLFEAWQTLLDHGFAPRVASAPLSSNPTSIEGKIRWLEKYMVPEFGAHVVEHAIIDKNKWKYPGIALIDDRPNVSKGLGGENQASWEHLLFGWEHVDEVPHATTQFRLLNWADTTRLLTMLKAIEERTI